MNLMKKMTIEFEKEYRVEITPVNKFFDAQWYKNGIKNESLAMGSQELLGYLAQELKLVEDKNRD